VIAISQLMRKNAGIALSKALAAIAEEVTK
jgi:hypothetical protein